MGAARPAPPVRGPETFGDPFSPNLVCRLFGHEPSLSDSGRCVSGHPIPTYTPEPPRGQI